MTNRSASLDRPTASAAASSAPRLDSLVKAYDVRGVVPDELDGDVVRALGWAFARFVAKRDAAAKGVVLAYDMRTSSPALAEAFGSGVTSAGVNVIMAGLASTDLLYFASGALDAAGVMFTASHNPARYNGLKM